MVSGFQRGLEMKDNFEKNNFIKQALLILIVIVLMSLLIFRLVDLQIVKGSTYRDIANENRFYTFSIKANRGVFLDRYHQPLVWNIASYYKLKDPEALYSSKEPIPKDQALSLMSSDESQVEKDFLRYYLYPQATAHILGYVSSVTQDDLLENRSLPVNKKIGRSGLESIYQDLLAGQDGQVIYEINALGERQRIVAKKEAASGKNLQTSIDPYLSQIALSALAGKKGSVIISDAKTAEILTMVSSPSFDPNMISNSWSSPEKEQQRRILINSYFDDPSLPFFNRSISGVYPPGSVFKLVTALTGLETGKIDTSTTVIDEGVLKVGEYQYGNWYYRQYGKVEGEIGLQRSIARSNDIFFYKVAEWVGPDALAEMARRFGFGSKIDFELSPQAEGLVPDPVWKEQYLGERWYLGNTYHFGIGQGDLLVTPLQVNQMGQILANKGTMCSFKLIKDQANHCHEVGVGEDHVNLVLSGMVDACSTGGTAYPFFTYNEQFVDLGSSLEKFDNGAVACKTGTAEFGAADANGHRPTHAWFLAIIEPKLALDSVSDSLNNEDMFEKQGEDFVLSGEYKTDPDYLKSQWLTGVKENGFPEKIVITVMLESDQEKKFKEGSQDAAPIAKQILDWMVEP